MHPEDFAYQIYHQAREELQAWSLHYFISFPDWLQDGVGYELMDNRSGDTVDIFLDWSALEYLASEEAEDRGAGWREFRIAYLEAAIDELEAE